MSPAPATPRRRPWRDNLEAITMAIIMAVMLKYFLVEAYQIPTGSMQPTLMGNDDTGIKDRIIVDKLSFHFRDPLRFEIAVFKYPLDRSKNFIKRICGMPGEELLIRDGDLWTRTDPGAEFRVLRRPRPVYMDTWKRLHAGEPRAAAWRQVEGGSWRMLGRGAVEARGDGVVRLPGDGSSVLDNYRDGYPGRMGDLLTRGRAMATNRPVGDLRLEGEVRALPGLEAVTLELREGSRVYRFRIPGPADAADPRPSIRADAIPGAEGLETRADAPFRLEAGSSVSFAVQNLDDLLAFEIGGETVAELEIPAARDQASAFAIRVDGEGADFSALEVYRDIYYTEDGKQSRFEIPPGHYVMLGDNTQDSSDSRFWTLVTHGPDPDGPQVRGNWFPPQNPVTIPGDPRGPRIFLRDEWGELHTWITSQAAAPSFEEVPLVPRDLIVGRAVLVFWPFKPSLGVWRLKWIR